MTRLGVYSLTVKLEILAEINFLRLANPHVFAPLIFTNQ